MMNLKDAIEANDTETFLNIVMDDPLSFNNYSRKGSKKECVFCQCAYEGKNSIIEASLTIDVICNHERKDVAYYAAAGNQIETLILLQNNNYNLSNAVIGAIKHGNYNAFMWLILNNYEETMKKLDEVHSILFKSAKGGNEKIFQYLLQKFPDYVSYIPKEKSNKTNENSLLRVATKYNHPELIDLILSAQNLSCISDTIPLINSIQNKNFEMTKKLIEITKVKKLTKNKLFDVAVESKNVDIIILLSEKYKITLKGLIFKAVQSNSIEFVRDILDRNIIDVNERNEYDI